MFEPKDDSQLVEAAPVTDNPVPVAPEPDPVSNPTPPGDYGIFNGASITVENGIVTVFVPFTNGSNITTVPVPLAAAWIVDNLAGAMLNEAKKHKP
jgi:hypothetical protein